MNVLLERLITMNQETLRPHLEHILENARLLTLLQPVLDLAEGRLMGYEALSRGPSDGPLHAPQILFATAEQHGLLAELDWACMRTAIRTFARLKLAGRLFVNLSPDSLLDAGFTPDAILTELADAGIGSRQLVIEITEGTPTLDYARLQHVVSVLHVAGIEVAIDDLGEGFSSLRLWSELQPAFVKIDKHFIAGLQQDPHKIQFVRSIQLLAEGAHSHVIAEGVESPSELSVLKDLGIRYAQGYLIGYPSSVPIRVLPREVGYCLQSGKVSVLPKGPREPRHMAAGRLATPAPTVSPKTSNQDVVELMMQHPCLHAVAVVDHGIPIGIIHRPALLDRFIGMYGRELYGRKPCTEFMDADPLIVDEATQIGELSELVVSKGKSAFTQGFIVTSGRRYLGLGSGFDLMREITEMQVSAARYANPLTGLPGNVPIQEHTERLLANGNGKTFVTAYFDLDQFKPYNDVYGFRRGDDMLQLVSGILRDSCNPELDFIGHIGGDDFVVLFQSPDWDARCHSMLARFDRECRELFYAEHVAAGGYYSEDRRGVMTFHALVTLSIGAVPVDPAHFHQYQEVARAASEAKRMAKRIDGSNLFVDQRRMPFAPQLAAEAKQRAAS